VAEGFIQRLKAEGGRMKDERRKLEATEENVEAQGLNRRWKRSGR
jgi:hypothetical protein